MNSLKRLNGGAARTALTAAAVCLFMLCFAPGESRAASKKWFVSDAAGTTSADFLNLPIGARASAMGGAYTAISEEASAIYWNPAGLVQIPSLSTIFMRGQYVQGVSYQYAAYAHRLSYNSVLASSIFLTDIGAINYTDINGATKGTFTPRDQVYTLSYSLAILEFSDKDMDVSIGVSAKYIKSQIMNSAHAYAGDLGIMTYNFTNIPYRLGVTMTNLGSGMRYYKESSPLPLTVKLAGAVNPFKNMMFSMDVVLPKQNKPNFLFGSEISMEPNELTRLSLRAGLNAQRLKDGLNGFTIGGGATLKIFSIDYAFVPMGDLGPTHNISLTFDFPYRNSIFQRRDRSIFTNMKGVSAKDPKAQLFDYETKKSDAEEKKFSVTLGGGVAAGGDYGEGEGGAIGLGYSFSKHFELQVEHMLVSPAQYSGKTNRFYMVNLKVDHHFKQAYKDRERLIAPYLIGGIGKVVGYKNNASREFDPEYSPDKSSERSYKIGIGVYTDKAPLFNWLGEAIFGRLDIPFYGEFAYQNGSILAFLGLNLKY